MSLLYRRPDSPIWYATKSRKSTRTTNRKLAEEFAKKELQTAWRDEVLDERVRTWSDLTAAWTDAKGEEKRSFDADLRVIRDTTEFLRRREMLDKPLSAIDADTIREYGKQIKLRASGATANRHLTIIRSMLRKAAKWRWISAVPDIELYKESLAAPRWLTREEFAAFITHLPPWVADMATVAVQTGMRYANVAGLRWQWIGEDLRVCHVPASHTKTGRMYTVPVSSVAKNVLEKLRGAYGRTDGTIASGNKIPDLVFQNPARPGELVESVRFWWDRACIKSGIDVRFHDLRHTWASWHLQAGTPDRIIQEAGGWAGPQMLQRYSHLATKHLTAYADNLNKEPTSGTA